MGQWKRLPDGSEVGEWYSAKSTGTNSLDIDLVGADGKTEHWKVHINPERGGEPNIPAPKAPVEVPKGSQAEPPQAPKADPGEPGGQTAPVESAPAPKGAPAVEPGLPMEGGWGGLSAVPFGPQPIHAPGSINHPFPILGEDYPWENPRDFGGHH